MINRFSLGGSARTAKDKSGRPLPIDEQFRMVRDAGVYDHYNRMPQPGEETQYMRASEKYGLPIKTGLWSYTAGKDEDLLAKNIRLSKDTGGECHNIMLYNKHAKGHVVTDDEVVRFYLHAYELAEKVGITVGLEVHIYMWSEDFRRVTRVANLVRAQKVPFNFVLDHSHVLLKVDNLEEQEACGIRRAVESGELIIDPYEAGNVLDEWINLGMTVWLQMRPVSPNGPKNLGEMNAFGTWGRACQYPFVKPKPGEWFHPWHAYRVEPSKEIVRRVLRYHRDHPNSPLRWISTDMIDLPDYGGGVKYSLFDQNVAMAHWIRRTWDALQTEPQSQTTGQRSGS